MDTGDIIITCVVVAVTFAIGFYPLYEKRMKIKKYK